MQNIIRPSAIEHLPEQSDCPVCGAPHINERYVSPAGVLNMRVTVYDCANLHSWLKHPGSVPRVPAILEKVTLESLRNSWTMQSQENNNMGNDNVAYRPLYDTVEPIKRLFQ